MYRRSPVYSRIRDIHQLRAERQALEQHLHQVEHNFGAGARRILNPQTAGTALQAVRVVGLALPVCLAVFRLTKRLLGHSKPAGK